MLPASAGARPPEDHLNSCIISDRLRNNIIIKTFNNGSLGSGIDEERSEMR